MAWGTSASVDNTSKSMNQDTNYTGQQTPIISPTWQTAFNNASANVGASGLTPEQLQAIAVANGVLSPTSSVANATAAQNTNLGFVQGGLNYLGANTYMPATTAAPRQAAGTTASNAPLVTAQTAASAMAPYSELYSQELIDPSLNAYDYGTDKAFSALDARTAGAGGFANSRSGLGYSDLGAQSALGRGTLEATAKNLGLTGAINAATGDVNRNLTADQFNSSNILGNNQFNAGQEQANNQFNVNAGYQGDQQKIQAADKLRDTLTQITGVSQQVLQNVITAQGINTDAANALFQAGTISQSQLAQLLQAAATTNGQAASGTENTAGTSDSTSLGAKANFSLP